MTHNPARSLMNSLDGDSALGLTKGTNLFYGTIRSTSSFVSKNAVFLLGAAGPPPLRSMQQVDEIRTAFINIQVRWNKFSTGDQKVRDIMNFVQALSVATFIDVRNSQSEPSFIGEEGEGNFLWSLGVEMTYIEIA